MKRPKAWIDLSDKKSAYLLGKLTDFEVFQDNGVYGLRYVGPTVLMCDSGKSPWIDNQLVERLSMDPLERKRSDRIEDPGKSLLESPAKPWRDSIETDLKKAEVLDRFNEEWEKKAVRDAEYRGPHWMS